MIRTVAIILYVLSLTWESCAQKPKKKDHHKDFDEYFDSLSVRNGSKFQKELDSLYKIHGDSAIFLSSLHKQFLNHVAKNNIEDSAIEDVGEFISSFYKIQLPPKSIGWINDFEQLFSAAERITLDSTISAYEKKTTNEIAIVTIPGYWVPAKQFDSLVLSVHNKWGVGKKGINNGIVIGISGSLRKIRISNGYGIENKLSNEETKNIIDFVILPHFRKGDFFKGTRDGLMAIIAAVE